MRVIPVPCLTDNYAYILICDETSEAAVVDPSEARPVLRRIQQLGAHLTAILNTHHHWDHVGGNDELLNHYPHLSIYGHHSDRGRIPGQTHFLKEQDPVVFGKEVGSITHNPGHTTGAISYYFGDAAFTGDTLFAAGCGRLFEGSPEDMHVSLNQKIAGRSGETRVFFGHEYTANNLRFALTIEPGNEQLQQRLAEVETARKAGEWTTPTTLACELATNPFMRCESAQIQATVKTHDPGNDLQPASILRVVRQLKDRF